ncbi:serpentine type 7TM GPCR chemoreceptor srh domain-containing protein [Ditylenchus destructor]|nr:serpentine type 7TM GPCR chemoreceptor srh domain-containing protein [Ditylenchus destructor]
MSSHENTLPDDEEYNIALLIITTATILLQCYVIFIIIYVSPKSMSDFRYFLCLISIWDLIFTLLLGYGLHPTFLFPSSAGQINGLFKYFGLTGANIGFCLILFAAVNVFNAQMFCLLFRVTVVLPNPKIHEWFMKPLSLILSQIYWMALSLAYAIPLYLILVKDKALITLITVISKSKPDAVIIALDFNPELPIRVNTVRYCAAIVGGVIYFEFFCLLMTIYIIKRLRKNAHLFSKKTYSLQIQFTLVLAFQFVSPLFVVVPLSMLMIQVVTESPPAFDRSAGKTGTVLLSIYTLSNSLVTVLFVTPYRKYTLAKFGICFGRKFREFVSRNSQLGRLKVTGMRRNNVSIIPASGEISYGHIVSPRP